MQRQGQFAETIEPLREFIAQNPNDATALYLYGLALSSTGQGGAAVWALHSAMTDPEYRLPAGKLFIKTLIAGDAFGDAIAACNELIEELGEEPDVLALRSYAKQASRQDYEGAIADADRVLELDPDNTDVLIPRTVSLLTLERVEEAGEALRQLDDLYKNKDESLKGSGKFCTAGAMFAWEKGEPDLALERFDRCLEDFPGNPVLLPRALSFFDQRRDFPRTLEILREALALKPEDAAIRQNLALRLEALGRHDEALETLMEPTESESLAEQIQAWATVAGFHAGTDNLDASLQAYEEALERSTTRSPELDFRYADTLIQAERYEEALGFAEKMTIPAQKSLIRGRIFLIQARPAEALEEFTAANRLWPNNAIARYYTAIAAEQIADIERAVEEYRYTIRIDSSATDAPIRLAQYTMALGDPPRAIGILTSSITAANKGTGRIEMEMLLARALSLAGRWSTANPIYVQTVMTPQRRAATIVVVAKGIRERSDLAAAADFLEESSKDFELTHPMNAAVLTQMVEWWVLLDRSPEALQLAKAAVDAHPDLAAFQSAHAVALAATGADPAEIAAAYARAFELNPRDPFVLRRQALFLEQTSPGDERIPELYAQLVEIDLNDVASAKKLASLQRARGNEAEALETLDDLVLRRPWDADALLTLASYLLEMPPSAGRIERAEGLYARAQQLTFGTPNARERLEQVSTRLQAASEAGSS